MQVEDIIDGGSTDTEMVEEVLENLSNVTKESTEEDNIIPPGDLNATLVILDNLATGREEAEAEVTSNEIKVKWSVIYVSNFAIVPFKI